MKQKKPGEQKLKLFYHLFISGKTLLQRLVITLQFFGKNSLANHAAACAYGFLLSAAPVLMMLSFLLVTAFRSFAGGMVGGENVLDPGILTALVSNISIIKDVLDENWLAKELPSIANSAMQFNGIAGIVSAFAIIWAGRFFALSLQRGLKIIFTGTQKRNPLTETSVVFIMELAVVIGAVLLIFFSRAARKIYETFDFFPKAVFLQETLSRFNFQIVSFILLIIVFYYVCRFLTANGPSRLSVFWGSLCFVFSYTISSRIITMLLDQTRYNFLYGALGNLILLLVNVYFFFMFFFFGAQLARVIDSFDVFLFLQLRFARIHATRPAILGKLFFSVDGALNKYLCHYSKGTTIFSRGDDGKEVFYLLEGEVDVLLAASGSGKSPTALQQGVFFGEMEHLLSETRNATIKAKTDVLALALPPHLFDKLLEHDASLDRAIMELLSQRLKLRNEQFSEVFSKPTDF